MALKHANSRESFWKAGSESYWKTGSERLAPKTARCPAQCKDDPYSKPGMVLWGKDEYGKETRYVAFPPSPPLDAAPLRTKELDVDGKAYWSNTTEAFELAVPAYTQAIKQKDEELVEFARGKIALFIGESYPVRASSLCPVVPADWLVYFFNTI